MPVKLHELETSIDGLTRAGKSPWGNRVILLSCLSACAAVCPVVRCRYSSPLCDLLAQGLQVIADPQGPRPECAVPSRSRR